MNSGRQSFTGGGFCRDLGCAHTLSCRQAARELARPDQGHDPQQGEQQWECRRCRVAVCRTAWQTRRCSHPHWLSAGAVACKRALRHPCRRQTAEQASASSGLEEAPSLGITALHDINHPPCRFALEIREKGSGDSKPYGSRRASGAPGAADQTRMAEKEALRNLKQRAAGLGATPVASARPSVSPQTLPTVPRSIANGVCTAAAGRRAGDFPGGAAVILLCRATCAHCLTL